MLTQEEVCTMCNRVQQSLTLHWERFRQLQKEEESVRQNIVALQAMLATLLAIQGQPYDALTVPINLWDQDPAPDAGLR